MMLILGTASLNAYLGQSWLKPIVSGGAAMLWHSRLQRCALLNCRSDRHAHTAYPPVRFSTRHSRIAGVLAAWPP